MVLGMITQALRAHLLPGQIIFEWASQLWGQGLLTCAFILRKILKIVVMLKIVAF